MKIKNYQINALVELLYPLPLKGANSRLRTKFLSNLMIHQKEYVLKHESELQLQYAERDIHGEIVYLDEEKTKFKVDPEFFKEKEILLNEEYIFDLNESNKITLLFISELLLEGDFEIAGDSAFYYEYWCEEAERVIDYYNK